MNRTIEELEELAISGDEAAARELELRYKELSAENRESDDAESEEYEEYAGADPVQDPDTVYSSETNDGSQAQNVTDAAAPEQVHGSDEHAMNDIDELIKLPTYRLKSMGDSGNLFAMVARGIKYIRSNDENEAEDGCRELERLRVVLQNKLPETGGDEYIDCLAKVLVALGNYYEKQFDEGDKDAGVKALEAYSNAGEIDTTALVLLAKCYERGVGCDVNLELALELREKSGEHSSAAARFALAESYLEKQHRLKGVEWLHLTLTSDDIENEKTIDGVARLCLAFLGETDEKGNTINVEDVKESVYKKASEGDALAVFYIYRLYGVEGVKQIPNYGNALHLAASDTRFKYVGLCARVKNIVAKEDEKAKKAAREAEQARIKSEEERRRQEKIAEAKRQEALKQERERIAKAEAERQEALRREEEQNRYKDFKKRSLIPFIMCVFVPVLLSASAIILNTIGGVGFVKIILSIVWVVLAVVLLVTGVLPRLFSKGKTPKMVGLKGTKVGVPGLIMCYALESVIVFIVLAVILYLV